MSVMRQFDLAPFDRIDISRGLEVQIGSGIAQSVRAEAADEEGLERLEVEVVGRTLRVTRQVGLFGLPFLGHNRILVSVTAPQIEAVAASAGCDVHFVGSPAPGLELDVSAGSKLTAEAIDVERLVASVSSGSKLALAGAAMIGELRSSSGSSLEADDLEVLHLLLDSASGSRISAVARDAARVDASSGSSVRLAGHPPRLDRHASSGASIHLA